MTCAIAGALGDEKASGPWKCYVAIFEATVHSPTFIIMCLILLSQDLCPKLKAIYPVAEMSCTPFLIIILRISAISTKSDIQRNTAGFIWIALWVSQIISSTVVIILKEWQESGVPILIAATIIFDLSVVKASIYVHHAAKKEPF